MTHGGIHVVRSRLKQFFFLKINWILIKTFVWFQRFLLAVLEMEHEMEHGLEIKIHTTKKSAKKTYKPKHQNPKKKKKL